jgi:hypothetical protein
MAAGVHTLEKITMQRTYTLGALLLCLAVSLSVAYGQGNCSINTITGSYAFNTAGSSTIISGVAPDTIHFNAKYAPIVDVGVFTVRSSFPRAGAALDGYYWLIAGANTPGLTQNPWHATITVNPDCTGTLTYPGPFGTMQEEMLILDNGNEIRSILQTSPAAFPTPTWIMTARRLNGACNQKQITGSYLFSCKSVFTLDATTTVGGNSLIRMTIASDGKVSAVFTGKFGPQIVPDTTIPGMLTLNGDCTAAGTLDFGTFQSVARGVFFNEGKEGYWLPLVVDPGGIPQPYGYCEITQIANR